MWALRETPYNHLQQVLLGHGLFVCLLYKCLQPLLQNTWSLSWYSRFCRLQIRRFFFFFFGNRTKTFILFLIKYKFYIIISILTYELAILSFGIILKISTFSFLIHFLHVNVYHFEMIKRKWHWCLTCTMLIISQWYFDKKNYKSEKYIGIACCWFTYVINIDWFSRSGK